jgi:hypothetical protein
MSFEAPSRSDGDFAKGLPPVTPPSGKFIVQLFLVPGLIVLVILAVLVPFVVWQTRPYRAEVLLEDLRNPNADVRWRAAERLSKVMPTDCSEESPRYALNVKFGLDLSEELRKAMDEETEILTRIGAKTRDDAPKDYKTLDAQQDLIRFLCGSLGYFDVPVTAPILCEIAAQPVPAENKVLLQRRQDAIWALAKLGDNLRYYHRLPEERRQSVLTDLARESETTGNRRKAAQAALDFLNDEKPMGVEAALETCAKSDLAAIRQLAAFAFSFWNVDEAEQSLIDLTHDDGRGADPSDEQRFYQVEIRNQAVVTLARHGSKLFEKNPHWFDVLAEMLNEKEQRNHFTTKIKDKEVVDEEKVRGTIENAVRALVLLHEKRPKLDLARFVPLLESVADTSTESLKSIKKEAEDAKNELSNTP